MKQLLSDGFGLGVNREVGMDRRMQDVCNASSGPWSYDQLVARGVRAVEQEHGSGGCFQPMIRSWCPNQVLFMTVIRNPIEYEIRARWDFQQQRMTTFTLPQQCNLVRSFVSLGGECKMNVNKNQDEICPTTTSADFGTAKTVLDNFAAVCITERYPDCPLVMARAMHLSMTTHDIEVFSDQYLTPHVYPSGSHRITSYIREVEVNGTSQAKGFLKSTSDILHLDYSIYRLAASRFTREFDLAEQYLRDRLKGNKTVTGIEVESAYIKNVSRVVELAAAFDADSD